MAAPIARRARPLLGTRVEVAVVAARVDADADADRAIDAAFAAIERVQRVLSAHDAASDIGRFNRAPVGVALDCDPWTIKLLALADRLRQDSAASFDIALGSAGGAAGYRIDGRRRLVRTTADAQLDAGGIAKGFAVDVAVLTLRASGARAGWVDAGGDLRVFGACARDIHIRDLRAPDAPIALGRIERGSVASSQYRADGRSAGKGDRLHVHSDSAGSAGPAPVAVIATRCAVADALTKPLAQRAGNFPALLSAWNAHGWCGETRSFLSTW